MKAPSFNYEGFHRALYCSPHKEKDMVNVAHKKCVFPGCKILPGFNYEGNISAVYCSSHKKPDMVHIWNKKCIFTGCKISAGFNYSTESKGLYCAEHRLKDMIDVHNKQCIYEGCDTIPTFNYEGLKNGLYCSEHKLKNMSTIMTCNICIFKNCKVENSFNYPSETKALYCAPHQLEGIVNVTAQPCQFKGCSITASFNYQGCTVRKFCILHCENGMINLNTVFCEAEDYKTTASFNWGLYCSKHKLDNMVNVCKDLCKTLLCDVIAFNPNYEGYCLRCFMYTFPDKPVARNFKTKEYAVVEYVYQHYPLDQYTWVNDKSIQGGCSLKRPDLILELGYQTIIIEVDENAHRQYNNLCDNRRTMTLSQDVGHNPIIFIRFNPDQYVNNDGILIPSCWEFNKYGVSAIKHKKEWDKRLSLLNETISYWLDPNNKSEATIKMVHLFFSD